MKGSLRRLLLACCGIPAANVVPLELPDETWIWVEPDWVADLRRAGYIVHKLHGMWHWRHAESGSQSGRYTTQAAAWSAAQLDHEDKQE